MRHPFLVPTRHSGRHPVRHPGRHPARLAARLAGRPAARLALAPAALAVGLLHPAAEALAEVCPEALGPNVTVVDSDVDCDSRVEPFAQVVDSTLTSGAPFPSPADGSVAGERTTVYASTLANAKVGPDGQIVGATLGQFELPVTLGPGAVVEPGARLSATDIGANARIARGAFVRGGRGIDFQRIGDDLVVGPGADIGVRVLGSGAALGADSEIGESTEAGDDFRLGARSVWVVGGQIGDDVTVGDDARIDGGFDAADGVTIGDGVTIDTGVRLGTFVQLFREASLGSGVQVGANALVGRAVAVGDDVSIGARVLIKRRAVIGEGASIGEGSIVEPGARVPAGAVVPPLSRVNVDGSVTPLAP